ncbi:MAG: helix-turn-helix transcriptional regulator [Clostridia bacterium]
MDNKKFGDFIKELRKEKQLTQKELGEKLNITDKAISKWERGLSFPDIAVLKDLAEFFEIDISELLNGERGKKQEIDIEKAIKEAIENYKNIEEKKKEKVQKVKKRIGVISIIIFVFALILQIVYLIIFKRHNYEYVIDALEYIINQIMILSATSSIILLLKKKKINIIIYFMAVIFTIANIAFLCNNGLKNKSVVSFSKDFSNELILKINNDTGSIKLYRNAKLFIFAKENEQFDYELKGRIKKQWIENDICGITYKDKNNKLREFVVTYGDRGDGISYYYVANALLGNWQVFTRNGKPTQMLVDSNGIKITKDDKSEIFEYNECKQYGTIALVLYKNEVPKYVIGLDKNCEIDNKTNIIKKDGTITLAEISMDKTKLESLYCMTYKNANDLSDYNI